MFDAKTVAGQTFAKSACDPHQLANLKVCSTHTVDAGYLIWYRDQDHVVWHKIDRLCALQPRQSLRAQDGIYLGSGGSMSILPILEQSSLD